MLVIELNARGREQRPRNNGLILAGVIFLGLPVLAISLSVLPEVRQSRHAGNQEHARTHSSKPKVQVTTSRALPQNAVHKSTVGYRLPQWLQPGTPRALGMSDFNLSGPVHIVTQGKIVNGSRVVDETLTFTGDGHLEETAHQRDGQVDWRVVHEYDDEGHRIRELHYDAHGHIGWEHTYTYDADGLLIRQQSQDLGMEKPDPPLTVTFVYDDKDNLIGTSSGEGSTPDISRYEWKGNQLIRTQDCDEGKGLKSRLRTVMTFDKNRRCVKIDTCFSGGSLTTEYSADGVMISASSMGKLETGKSYDRSSYDSHGLVEREDWRSPEYDETSQYTYQFDEYDNWVIKRQVRENRRSPVGAFREEKAEYREIEYW